MCFEKREHVARRALIVLSVFPVWFVSAVACLWLWPLQQAAGHLAILGTLGLLLAELCLHRFHKIPYTCTYLPGKSQVHMTVLAAMALLWTLAASIRYEMRVLDDARGTAAVIAALALVTALVRWRARVRIAPGERVEFDDSMEPAVRELGLGPNG